MLNLLIRDSAIKRYQYYVEHGGEAPIVMPPQSIYLELSKDDKFREVAPNSLLNLVVGAQWRENELLDALQKDLQTRAANLVEYKALIDGIWEKLCKWRIDLNEVS